MYDRGSLRGLKQDIKTVASVWFNHDQHESVDEFVWHYSLEYVNFDPHDRYSGPTQYEMSLLFRLFLLKELHRWNHETALVEHLQQHPTLCDQLDFETIPDQSTLWRTWHCRFSTDFRETIQQCARTILVNAEMAGVDVPQDLSVSPVWKEMSS